MKQYMLDTNMVSQLIKGHSLVAARILAVPMTALCISSITKGELLFGLAKRPDAKRLHLLVKEFLRRVDVLPWDGEVAEHYGTVRAEFEKRGKTLGPLDLQIAAHALGVKAVLVTNDQAFNQVTQLNIEDWTI